MALAYRLIRAFAIALIAGAACIVAAAAQSPDARALCQSRDIEKAIEACSQIIAASQADGPTYRMALLFRARAYLTRSEWSRAIADLDQRLQLDSTSPLAAESYALRATAHYQAADFPGAIADAEAALKLNPRNEQALKIRSFAHVAQGTKSSDSGFAALPDALVAYVAHGPAGACGPGCDEWLAVEGTVDREGPRRVTAALDRLGARKLPVVLDFRGPSGFGPAMSIGKILRERGFDTTVGRTLVDECDDDQLNDRCTGLKRAGKPLPATLVASAACRTDCLLGLAGGVRRTVPAATRVVIGSIFSPNRIGLATIPVFREGRVERIRDLIRAHLAQMGFDPRVSDMIGENYDSTQAIEVSREDVVRLRIATEP
ncbi:MAG: tetratricopeptide repeat protein [Alphaproteobacteria bacterium]|nr:tetratricopeptide repeat protein [Alphaproteobacteria bacterium]